HALDQRGRWTQLTVEPGSTERPTPISLANRGPAGRLEVPPPTACREPGPSPARARPTTPRVWDPLGHSAKSSISVRIAPALHGHRKVRFPALDQLSRAPKATSSSARGASRSKGPARCG